MKRFFSRKNRSFNKKTSIREVLRGCEAGRLQSVGYMQVIPLISDLEDDRFVSPAQCDAAVYTTNYGTMGFRNTSRSMLIIPCHAGYVVKQRAQNHAMTHTGLVAEADDRVYDTAACIQASQAGLIKRGAYRMLILPHALRANALNKRSQKSYDKLWNDISEFNQTFGLTAHGHLEYFLKSFRKELDEFVAEFECVPRQVGAIVLIDNRIVGIERAPSEAYWLSIWPSLIRECYGSLAIAAAKANRRRPNHRRRPDETPVEVASLDELESLIADIAAREDEQARATVRELLDETLSLKFEETVAGISVETATSESFAGQLIHDGRKIAYASLPATAAFIRAQEWTSAKAFSL